MRNYDGVELYFSSPVYVETAPQFLDSVTTVSEEALAIEPEVDLNGLFPMRMSQSYYDNSAIASFAKYIGDKAWDILDSQGYDMQQCFTQFGSMWTQEHYRGSLMEQHIHGHDAHIVGMYFLNTPDGSSRLLLHDPRPGKVQAARPQKDETIVSHSSSIVNFVPKPGMLIMTNSWLPHSFSKHEARTPLSFVHFTLKVRETLPNAPSMAEVI